VTLDGEQDTEIRDERKICSSANNYNDQNNVIVTLFDNTAYILHIEVHCVQPLAYENSYNQYSSWSETSCNHAQYLGVWVDFNNDGIFDENRERIPNNSYEDDQRTATYDLTIVIPTIDGRNYLNEQHRIRIVLTEDEGNRKPCYNSGYGEARDYIVQILSKPGY
jgi:hypothetical protein